MLWALSRALNLLMHANIDYIVLLQSNLLLILLKKKTKVKLLWLNGLRAGL